MPVIMFIGNLNYVLVAVIGGLRVASGQLSLGDVQAFIQYTRQFTQPLTQVARAGAVRECGDRAIDQQAIGPARLPGPVQRGDFLPVGDQNLLLPASGRFGHSRSSRVSARTETNG